MTGPPTPPPSSATEIEDAARTAAPPQLAAATQAEPAEPAAEPTPEQVQAPTIVPVAKKTSYELLFPRIVALAQSGTPRELIEVAERGDLTGRKDTDHTRLFIVAPLVLAYMIVDELTPARYALTRLPNNLASLQISQNLFNLLASVSERKYTQIYVRAETLCNMISEPGFPNAELGQLLVSMIDVFVETFRKKTFALLTRAYTSLPLRLAQTYLGLTAEQVINVAVPAGWDFHETTHILTPPKQSTSGARRAVDSVPSTVSALSLVAESVANLEA